MRYDTNQAQPGSAEPTLANRPREKYQLDIISVPHRNHRGAFALRLKRPSKVMGYGEQAFHEIREHPEDNHYM